MEEILEKLLNMRSLLDNVIKRIEDERKEGSTTDETMENIIFNPKVFNTPEKWLD